MNKRISKWLALAALLMFVGATFQIANDHFILGIICFGAAAAFTTSANVYRERAKKEKQRQREEMKTERRQISREEREAEAQRRFEMKQTKKKEKRRGH